MKKWLNAGKADKNEFKMSYIRAKLRDEKWQTASDPRLRVVLLLFSLLTVLIVGRLVVLMFLQHNFYVAMATGSREFYNHLFPKRGVINIQDSRTKEEYPLAMNRDYFLLYGDTRDIPDDKTAEEVTNKLAEIFGYNDERKLRVYNQLNKRTDPYEPLENKVEENLVEEIRSLNLPGLNFIRQPFRYYPEGNLASNIVGFLGKTSEGSGIGRYGIEGYWQKELAGKSGFVSGNKTALGSLIPLSDWSWQQAENGVDMLLTIDRTLQYKACEILRQAQLKYKAESASLIIMDSDTGAIRAMCSLPDFDPNNYGKVENIQAYNNNNIFTQYEPGSVFKSITMAAALNENLVTPQTTFVDSGQRGELCSKPIKNAAEKVYGLQTMTGVLENSINTGMVFIVEKLGKSKFKEYINNFGFGVKSGIELDTEVSGDLRTLDENKRDRVDCYTATASFGQGITATPLQLVTAYTAIANGGKLMKPYLVEEIRYQNGKIERFKPKEIRTVLESSSAALLRGMLVSVIESGQTHSARVEGYYIGGKTGTAQIPGPGGYGSETNHTFVGIAPADNPKFVMLVKFEKPAMAWADSTTAPVFSEVAKFALQYYQIPPNR